MRTIHKKISLVPYKSRINGILTSYNDEIVEKFSTSGNVITNYGMFPFDVKYDEKILSYPTLIDKYNFIKKYKKMLEYDACSGVSYYKDAVDYFKHEINNSDVESIDEYIELDEIFDSYGGDDFYEWCKKILFSGENSEEPTYPKWYMCEKCGKLESGVTDTITCPICNEEIQGISTAHINIQILFTNTIDDLGEMSIFSNEWEDGVDYRSYADGINSGTTVIYNDEIWQFNNNSSSGCVGSIYSEKYKERYFPQINGMPYDDDYKWYKKSKDLNKIEFDENQWVNNTELYFSNIGDKHPYKPLMESCHTYSYKDDKIIYEPTPRKMADKYFINTNGDMGYFIINNKIHTPFKSEYIEYGQDDNKRILLVHNVEAHNLNMKYVVMDDKKFFSKTETDGGEIKHYFIFGDIDKTKIDKCNYESIYEKTYFEKKEGVFLTFNGEPYIVNNNSVIINDITYENITGYFDVDGRYVYIKDGGGVRSVVTMSREEEGENVKYYPKKTDVTFLGKQIVDPQENDSFGYEFMADMLFSYKPYVVYDIKYMSGKTESKLSSFVSDTIAYDDMGNKLPRSV